MDRTREYHLRQHKEIYESTKKLCEWIDSEKCFENSKTVLDMCCGGGANTCYLAEKYKNISFVGIDISDEALDIAKEYSKDVGNCVFVKDDLYNLGVKYQDYFDGVIGFQMLSWMNKDDFRDTLLPIINLNPKWIALSSLFYEGDVEYIIKEKRYVDNHLFSEGFHNVFSLNLLRSYLKKYGYDSFIFVPFEIDIDLPEQVYKDIGTFTKKLVDGSRIQISGGLLMSWYFILAKKKTGFDGYNLE